MGIGLAAWSLAVAAGASRRRDMVIAALLLCASWTIYEATWFFWLPPALLLLARIRHRRPSDRTFWTFVGLLAVLQVAFVVLNRLLATGSPVAKKLSGQLLGTLATDEHLLGAQLLPQLQAVWLPLQVGLAVLLACALLQSLRSGSFLRLLVQLAVPVCGMAITVLLYAAAGYAIEWEGLFSRVTLAISFWLALLAGALAQATEGAGWKTLRWTGRAAATLVCVALAASLLQQSQPWLRSWEEQQAIVAAFPEPVLKRVNPQTLVLMDLPRGPAPVYGFSAFWDISGALIARVPREQTISSSTHAYATVMRPTEWRTSWDGAELRQSWCSSPDSILWRLPAERVIVWRYPGQEVVEVAPGFTTGCAAKPAP